MNYNIFTNKISGKWIAQSTYYSLIRSQNQVLKTITNYVECIDCIKNPNFTNFIKKILKREEFLEVIALYQVQFVNNKLPQQFYYIVFAKKISNELCLLKFNQFFNLINIFIIKNYSRNYLHLISQMDNLSIIEKIYFLNSNLKVIKSIIKKGNKCVATTFSSEIKIS